MHDFVQTRISGKSPLDMPTPRFALVAISTYTELYACNKTA